MIPSAIPHQQHFAGGQAAALPGVAVPGREPDIVNGRSEIRIRGKNVMVPATSVGGATVIVAGRFVKIASVKDDSYQFHDPVPDPELFVRHLREHGPRAHVFTFAQRLPDITPRFPYRLEWDNVAAVSTVNFDAWWERLSQETRKNVRRAQKRGVEVKTVALTDDLIRGIVDIYNEGPLRQGKPFFHYGKDFERIKREVSTFSETSEFIAAYKDGELIGFIKLVHMGAVASIMHIVSKQAHADKRPTNALLAEAIALCGRKGVAYLIYGNYTYGRKTNSSLAEFKRRNGFEQILLPRYYIPVTLVGRAMLALNLHRGIIGILPPAVTALLLRARAKVLEMLVFIRRTDGTGQARSEAL